MKSAITSIIDQYGMYFIHYAFMVFGNEPDVKITFGDEMNSPDELKRYVIDAVRVGGQPHLEKALQKAADLFEPGYVGERPGVKKFLVVIVDRNTVGDERIVMRHAKVLMNSDVKVSGWTLFTCAFFFSVQVLLRYPLSFYPRQCAEHRYVQF